MIFIRTVLFLLAIMSARSTEAKKGTDQRTFRLSGTLKNYSSSYISIYFLNDSLNENNISLPVINGSFNYTNYSLKNAFAAYVRINNLLLPLAIAPGYNINFTADGSSDSSILASINITGKGSIANLFYQSFQHAATLMQECYAEDYNKSIECFILKRQYTDSLHRSFSRKFIDKHDPYLSFFKSVALYDAEFSRLEHLSSFLKSNLIKIGSDHARAALSQCMADSILKNISDKKYLASPQYIWMIGQGNQYLFFITMLEHIDDTVPVKLSDYLLQIDKIFKGRNKDYYLKTFITMSAGVEGSHETFMKKKEIMINYVKKIQNGEWKLKLSEYLLFREDELVRTRIGQEAPFFSLEDSAGKFHSISEFKGKTVLLDFWASWCSPCRSEIPYLKRLHEYLTKREDIVFISIAVRDNEKAWHKAIVQDDVPWLHLWGNEATAAAYFTNAIPKFVIIDKRGNIVDFQAPLPSNGNKLKEILENQ